MTYVYTRESLASLFRAAADALQSPATVPEPIIPSSQANPSLDYAQALESYLSAHSHELGNLVAWCRKKYQAEPTQNKGKSLLAYAQKQVALAKSNPGPEPTF